MITTIMFQGNLCKNNLNGDDTTGEIRGKTCSGAFVDMFGYKLFLCVAVLGILLGDVF